MARKNTKNLNLVQPDRLDQYNIDDFNSNMGKIDNFAGLTPPRAITADKLTTGRKINGVVFDGTQDIQAPDDSKVAKAGDTMTGNLTVHTEKPLLTVRTNPTSEYGLFDIQSYHYNMGNSATPSKLKKLGGVRAIDNINKKAVGELSWEHDENNFMGVRLYTQRIVKGQIKYARFQLAIDSQGNLRTFINGQELKAFVKDYYHNGKSFFRIYTDGFIIQGGEFIKPAGVSSTEVALIKPFAGKNYCVVATDGGSSRVPYGIYISSNSRFTLYGAQGQNGGTWIAMGI